jgi:hypothetical protein
MANKSRNRLYNQYINDPTAQYVMTFAQWKKERSKAKPKKRKKQETKDYDLKGGTQKRLGS